MWWGKGGGKVGRGRGDPRGVVPRVGPHGPPGYQALTGGLTRWSSFWRYLLTLAASFPVAVARGRVCPFLASIPCRTPVRVLGSWGSASLKAFATASAASIAPSAGAFVCCPLRYRTACRSRSSRKSSRSSPSAVALSGDACGSRSTWLSGGGGYPSSRGAGWVPPWGVDPAACAAFRTACVTSAMTSCPGWATGQRIACSQSSALLCPVGAAHRPQAPSAVLWWK